MDKPITLDKNFYIIVYPGFRPHEQGLISLNYTFPYGGTIEGLANYYRPGTYYLVGNWMYGQVPPYSARLLVTGTVTSAERTYNEQSNNWKYRLEIDGPARICDNIEMGEYRGYLCINDIMDNLEDILQDLNIFNYSINYIGNVFNNKCLKTKLINFPGGSLNQLFKYLERAFGVKILYSQWYSHEPSLHFWIYDIDETPGSGIDLVNNDVPYIKYSIKTERGPYNYLQIEGDFIQEYYLIDCEYLFDEVVPVYQEKNENEQKYTTYHIFKAYPIKDYYGNIQLYMYPKSKTLNIQTSETLRDDERDIVPYAYVIGIPNYEKPLEVYYSAFYNIKIETDQNNNQQTFYYITINPEADEYLQENNLQEIHLKNDIYLFSFSIIEKTGANTYKCHIAAQWHYDDNAWGTIDDEYILEDKQNEQWAIINISYNEWNSDNYGLFFPCEIEHVEYTNDNGWIFEQKMIELYGEENGEPKSLLPFRIRIKDNPVCIKIEDVDNMSSEDLAKLRDKYGDTYTPKYFVNIEHINKFKLYAPFVTPRKDKYVISLNMSEHPDNTNNRTVYYSKIINTKLPHVKYNTIFDNTWFFINGRGAFALEKTSNFYREIDYNLATTDKLKERFHDKIVKRIETITLTFPSKWNLLDDLNLSVSYLNHIPGVYAYNSKGEPVFFWRDSISFTYPPGQFTFVAKWIEYVEI